MRFKGILLDIDNTLYGYDKTHKIAQESLFKKISQILGKDDKEVKELYNKARGQIHLELHGTASSHNRLLYIQRLLELANVNALENSLELYNHYWDTFVDSIEVYDEVYVFLDSLKDCKICLLTDLTADIQFKKVKKLQLDRYVDSMVTSEEAGIEKPHPYMFMSALNKLNLDGSEVCMIGDNFDKDIIGATNLGIQSYWINQKGKDISYDKELITEFSNFQELRGYIHG